MTNMFRKELAFEKAFRSIELATWNRQRTNNEIQSFLTRREKVVEDAEI